MVRDRGLGVAPAAATQETRVQVAPWEGFFFAGKTFQSWIPTW